MRSSFRLEPTFPLRHWPVVGLLSAVFSVGRCAVPLRRRSARGGWNIRGFCGTIRQGEPLRRCALTAKGRRGAPSDSPLPTGLGPLTNRCASTGWVVGLLGVVFCLAVVLSSHG